MHRYRLGVMGTVAALALCASAAQAQTEERDAPARTGAGEGIGEIVVTAQKRSENIQSVPVSVSAFTDQTFARNQINGVQDLNNAVPSLLVQRNPNSSNSAQIFLRGIGQDNSTIFDEVAVGVYVDGVYMGRNLGALLDLNNFERVEVLRGPQGTLYGRNSTGGAIKLVSRRPAFDDLSFTGDVTTGSFNRFDVRGAVNIPIASNVASNISFTSFTNDGWYRNSETGQKLNTRNSQSIRGTLLWDAADDLSVFIAADHSVDRSSIQVGTQMSATSGPGASQPLYGDIFEARPDVPDVNNFKGSGVSATIDYATSLGKFQSISAYRWFDYRVNLDLGGAPIGPDLIRKTSQNQISQEFQFTSDFSDFVQAVLGLYYFRERAHEDVGFVVAPGVALPFGARQTSESYAAYGQLEFKFMPWLTGIAGGRFTHDKKDVERSGIFEGVTASKSWNKFNPKLGLSAQVDRNALLFFAWSQGYKAGVYQPFPTDVATASAALDPETVDSIEFGAKVDWFDKRLRTNISLFQNKFKDLQLSLLSNGGAVESVSADLTVKGIEAEITAAPFDGLLLTASGSILSSHFDKVPPPGVGTPEPGDHQKFAPPFAGRFGAEYSWDVSQDNRVSIGASYDWTSHVYHGYPNRLTYKGGFGLLDARLAYTHGDGDWGLELAAKNLTDKHYWNYTSYLAGLTRFYQPGRTWSLRLNVRF